MKIIKIKEKFYCITNKKFSYENFEDKISNCILMRKNSFSFRYTIKIFRELFEYSIDLKKDYLEYYYEEYDDFEKYLYHKELLEWETIDKLNIKERETLLRLRLDISNYNTSSFLEYEDDTVEVLNKFLEVINNENKE